MAGYIDFTEEQKQRANSVDLVDYLRRRGEKLTRSGREWRWERHNSVTIQGSAWYRHKTDEFGHALDFVQEFFNLSFPEAMLELLGGINGADFKQENKAERPPQKPFALPEANSDMHRVIAYLLKNRFIDRDVLTFFAKGKLIYEDKKYHNAVFVGYDENGVARHAHKRGTYSEGKSYRVNVEGSDPRYSFHYIGSGDTIYVFEAPIDMLSFITLHKNDWWKNSYVALNGVGTQTMLHILDTCPRIKNVAVCLDHDPAGIEMSEKAMDQLKEHGGCEMIARLQSVFKDWNEDLKAKHGAEPIPAKEHPRIEGFRDMCKTLLETCKNMPASSNAQYNLIDHLQNLRSFLQSGIAPVGKEAKIMHALKETAVNALLASGHEYRQLGEPKEVPLLVNELHDRYRVYQDRSSLRNQARDIRRDAAEVTEMLKSTGIRSEQDKRLLIEKYMGLALDCAKAHISVDFQSQAQMQRQEDQATNFNMAM